MRFFQTGELAEMSENRPDKQSGEELSVCLKGTYWSRLPVEMQIEIIKQVISITFNFELKIFILEEKLFQTVSINFFITHNELEDFQKNLDDGDKLNLLCAYPELLSIIGKSYSRENPIAANEGKDTESDLPDVYIEYVSFLESPNLL